MALSLTEHTHVVSMIQTSFGALLVLCTCVATNHTTSIASTNSATILMTSIAAVMNGEHGLALSASFESPYILLICHARSDERAINLALDDRRCEGADRRRSQPD